MDRHLIIPPTVGRGKREGRGGRFSISLYRRWEKDYSLPQEERTRVFSHRQVSTLSSREGKRRSFHGAASLPTRMKRAFPYYGVELYRGQRKGHSTGAPVTPPKGGKWGGTVPETVSYLPPARKEKNPFRASGVLGWDASAQKKIRPPQPCPPWVNFKKRMGEKDNTISPKRLGLFLNFTREKEERIRISFPAKGADIYQHPFSYLGGKGGIGILY